MATAPAPSPRSAAPPRLNVLIALGAGALAILAATGVVSGRAFAEPSVSKYALTVAAPLLAMLAATSETPLRWLVVPAIVAAPFQGASAFFGSLQVSILAPFVIAGIGIAVLTGRRPLPRSQLLIAGALAFPLLAIPIALGHDNGSFISTLALMLGVGWLVSRATQERDGLRVVVGAICLSALIQGAIAIWQRQTGHQLNLYGTAGSSTYAQDYFFLYGTSVRPTGSFTDPISLGNMLAPAIPLAVALTVEFRDRVAKLAVGVALAVAALGLTLSLSRMAWIGAAAGVVATVVMLPRRARRRTLTWLVPGTLVVAIATVAIAGSAVTARLNSISDPTNVQGQTDAQTGVAEGDRNRLLYWRIAMEQGFAEHPAAGIGIGDEGEFLRARVAGSGDGIRAGTSIFIHAHSTYFQLLSEGGLFALALFGLFFRGLYRDLRSAARGHSVIGAGLAGSAVAVLICWLTDWVIHNGPVAASVACVFGAIAGAARVSAAQEAT